MQLNGQLSSRAGVKQERGNQDCEWISHGSKSFPWLVLRPVNYSANSFSSIEGLELEIKDWSFLIGNLADRARGGSLRVTLGGGKCAEPAGTGRILQVIIWGRGTYRAEQESLEGHSLQRCI